MSKQRIYFLVVLIMIVYKIFLEFQFSDIGADKLVQLDVAGNLNTWGKAKVFTPSADDLAINQHYAMQGYPLGYSLLISKLSFSDNLLLISSIIDSIIIIVIFILTYLSLLRLGENKISTLKFLCFIGIVLTPFCELTSTDLLATSFMLAIFYCAINIYIRPKRLNIVWFIIISILTPMMVFIKLSAYPLILVTPLSLFLLAIIKKNRRIVYSTIISFFASLAFIVLQNILFPLIPKAKVLEKGFYPENLLQIIEFPFYTFFHSESIVEAIDIDSIVVINNIAAIIFSILIIGISMFYGVKFILKQNIGSLEFASLNFSLAFLGLTFFLGYLSLTIVGEPREGAESWTFISEYRYFGPVVILMLISVWLIYRQTKLESIRKGLFWFLTLSALFNIVYGGKQLVNFINYPGGKYTYSFHHPQDFLIMKTLSQELISKDDILISDDNLKSLRIKCLTKFARRMSTESALRSGFKSSKNISIYYIGEIKNLFFSEAEKATNVTIYEVAKSLSIYKLELTTKL